MLYATKNDISALSRYLYLKCSLSVVDLFDVSEQGLGEGGSQVTEVTLPWLVVLVISVHVVHQPSEAPALETTQLTDAELLVTLRYFLLCGLTHQSCPGSSGSCHRSASLSLQRCLVIAKELVSWVNGKCTCTGCP